MKAIIIGSGTYGQVYAEYLRENGQYEIIGFLDDDLAKTGLNILGIKVLGVVSLLETIENKESISVFVAIGNNKVRLKILKYVEKLGYKTPGFIHSSCNIPISVEIGKSVYILPGCNIMPRTILHDYVMISMGVNIAHHVIVESGCFFSQGANVGASITIGEQSLIGIGSTIKTNVKRIGKNVLIGAGAVVIRDVPDNAVIVGNPGKILRYQSELSSD